MTSFALQVLRQKTCEDILPIVRRGFTTEIDATEFLTIASGPATVVPWTNDQKILAGLVMSFE